MNKHIKLLLLLLFNINVITLFSENIVIVDSVENREQLTSEKVIKDVQDIKGEMDTALYNGKKIINIIALSIDEFGLKNTIKIHSDIFIPLFIFGSLFLINLKRRKQ